MWCFLSNPLFLMLLGAVISFAGSVYANHLYFGKIEKSRATREAKRAYNKLMNVLMHTTLTDLSHPLHLLPVEIADCMEDLRYAIEDVNPEFDYQKQVQAPIEQAVALRKQQQREVSSALAQHLTLSVSAQLRRIRSNGFLSGYCSGSNAGSGALW